MSPQYSLIYNLLQREVIFPIQLGWSVSQRLFPGETGDRDDSVLSVELLSMVFILYFSVKSHLRLNSSIDSVE